MTATRATDRFDTFAPYVPALIVIVVQLVLFGVPSGVWIQGIVLGLLNALVALGLALIWRSNRILNFAQADIGTLPAALGVAFCVFWSWNWFAGLAIGLAAAVIVGALTEIIVIRRFRNAPRLTLTVATIGISQFCILLALLVPQLWGETVLASPNESGYAFPWKTTITIGQQVFHSDDLVAAALSIVCLLAVGWFLKSSDTGIAVRAAAERSTRAELLGIPVLKMELITWVVASVLSFLGVFLQGAILGFPLNISIGIVTLVTALAALALGGFDRIGPILVSAVALGILLQGVRWHNTVHPSFVYAILGAVIAVAMLARRRVHRRQDRDPVSSWLASLEPRPMPASLGFKPFALALGAGVFVLAVLLPIGLGDAQRFALATMLGFGIVAVSIAVLTGWAGQITLGQMGFAALGASLGAACTITWNLDVTLGLLIVLVAGAIAGVIVGLPSLRFTGLLPAAVTLAFALAASGYLFDPNQFTWIPTDNVVPQKLLGVWNVSGSLGSYEFALVVTALCVIGLLGIRSSSVGRAIRGLRDNDLAAQSYAISPAHAKLTAYGISGSLAAVGGFVLVHVAQHYDTATFAPAESLTIFTASVVGGVGSLLGVLLGAGYLNGSRWLLSGYWQLLPTAVGVLVVLWLFPGGFSSLLYKLRDRFATRRAEAMGVELLGPATEKPWIETPISPVDDAGALLSVRDVRVAYGGVDILFGVDLTVRPGEVLALLGTNGAGKSTLLRAISGVTPMRSGEVHFGGDDITRLPSTQIAQRGLAQMPGGQAVFESLTVAENLRMAGWMIRSEAQELEARIEHALNRFEVLSQRIHEPAANLSGGQQQLLGMAMALLSKPKLVMIDELTLGLSPLAASDIIAHVRELQAQGTTIVIVDQSVDVALRVADRAYFLERGTLRFEGSANDLAKREDLLRSVYLTHSTKQQTTQPDHIDASQTDEKVLAINAVSVAFGGPQILDDVTIDVSAGELCVFIGPNGAGKTTLFDVISGFTPIQSGHVELFGRDVTALSAARRAHIGLGRSFQDSRLFPALTVKETIAVATNRWITAPDPASAALRLPVRQIAEYETTLRVDDLIDLMGLGRLAHHRTGELSTGQRRLVDIACSLAHHPKLLLLDEPSSGVAQSEAEELVPVLQSLRTNLGATLIVVEHDMAIASELASRMVALDQGQVLTTGSAHDVLNHPRVIEAYLGQRVEPQGTPT